MVSIGYEGNNEVKHLMMLNCGTTDEINWNLEIGQHSEFDFKL